MKKFAYGVLKRTIFIILSLTIAFIFINAAPPDTSKLDGMIKWILAWVARVGIIVAIFGGIQLSLGFKNDDADGKIRGLKTMVSGFMVYGITQAPSLFGL